jgi:SAM-dependent methyltransferase
MDGGKMRRFWDRRAGEDAFFFVDNRLAYRDPDAARFWQSGRRDLDTILDELGIAVGPDEEIVEIGCGVGRLTRVLADRGRNVRALDVSERMLDLARGYNAHLQNVEWLLGDGTNLAPVADASADACFSHVVFQHIPDPDITLGYVREMARVLRPGGWAAFQVSNAPGVHRRRSLLQRLRGLVQAIRRRGPWGQGNPAWLGSAVDLDRLRVTAESAGLTTERIEGAGTQMCLVLLRRRATGAAA